MPYIPMEQRSSLDPAIALLARAVEATPDSQAIAGRLNYAITNLLLRIELNRSRSYSGLATIVGVLESLKLEFYRRLVAEYEDGKIAENGDVYRCGT